MSRRGNSIPGARAATPTCAFGPTDRPMAILLVDDDADCRMLIRDAITETHPDALVCEVPDAETALAFLQRRCSFADAPRPALIYLDMEMPGMSGIELAELIKRDAGLCDIPVVMMTGVCDEQRMRAAASAGANSYTIKPSDARQFFETVAETTRYWLDVHQYPHRHLPESLCRR